MNDQYLPGSVWTYVDALAVFFGGLIGAALGLGIVTGIAGEGALDDVWQLIVISLGQALTILAVVTYLSKSRGTASWDVDFGLRFQPSDFLGVLYGLALQIGVVALVLYPLQLLLGLDETPQQSAVDTAGEATALSAQIAIVIMFVILAPLTEELVYRVILLSRARRAMSPRNSILLTSAIFAGIHLVDPNAIFAVPGLFVVGLVLGYQALRTGRLGLSIATHAGFNLLTTVGLLLDMGA